MTLRQKMAWLLVLVLMVVFGVSTYSSVRQSARLMSKGLGVASTSLETAAEAEAMSVFASLEVGTKGSLERGEMELFSQLLSDLGSVKRIGEIGLTDAHGKIKYSNRPRARQHRMRNTDLAEATANPGQVHTVWESNALLLIRPHLFERACLKCHEKAKVGEVAGVLYLRYDLQPMRAEQQRLKNLLATLEERGLSYNLLIGAGALVIAFLAVYLLFGTLVLRPLQRLEATIQAVERGQIDARVNADGSDEIASVSGALDRMAARLEEVVGGIERSSKALGKASQAVARSSTEVSASVDRQASSVQQTSSAVEDIVSAVLQVGRRVSALNETTEASATSVAELGSSIGEVAQTAETLARDAEQISASVEEINASLASGTRLSMNLKASASNSAASVSQMSASVQEVEGQARHVATIAGKVAEEAQRGKQAVEATIQGIGEIRSAFDLTFEVIRELSDKMRSIGSILSVIDEVTGRTNLLALNAAIMAAQAGEHGRGFAVVADEIRDLADRTGGSTREIAAVVGGLRAETERVEAALEVVDRSIHEGRGLSLQAGSALADIVKGVEDASAGIGRIAQAMVEQTAGIVIIQDTVNTVSDTLSANMVSTEEQNRAASLIANAVARMRELADQVRRATHEQRSASQAISQTVTHVNKAAQEIRDAMGYQRIQCDRIVSAVGDIKAGTDANIATARSLNVVVTDIGAEVAELRTGVRTLRRPKSG